MNRARLEKGLARVDILENTGGAIRKVIRSTISTTIQYNIVKRVAGSS